MRGILSAAAYLPRGRLDRSSIAPFVGTGGGRGTRTVASYDEDTTTMAVEAGRLALHSTSPAVRPEALWFATVAAADIRTGLPGGADEAMGGDGAAAILVGEGPVIAEHLGGASATEEFLDRWRRPGEPRSKLWEERFGETKYVALGERAWREALKRVDVSADQVDVVLVTSTHARAARSLASRLGTAKEALADDLSATVGNTGAAHPALLLTRA